MRLGVNPILDCCFHKLFGSEKNKAVLLVLLNAILEEHGEKKVIHLEILNPYKAENFPQEKMGSISIEAEDEAGEWLLLELRMNLLSPSPKRILYEWAKKYHEQIQDGENSSLLKKIILISITQKALPLDTKSYLNCFHLVEKGASAEFCGDLKLYTLELEKFLRPVDELNTVLEKWVYFFKYGEELDEQDLPQSLQVPEIENAIQELKTFRKEPLEKGIYEIRRKIMMERMSELIEKEEMGVRRGREEGEKIGFKKGEELGFRRGREEGEEVGVKQGKAIGEKMGKKEIARKLLGMWHLSIEEIAQITGLSKDEIIEESK